MRRAGSLLKRLVAGLVMVEAQARAKAQMGAEATGLQLEGNNPIKFARSRAGAGAAAEPGRARLHGVGPGGRGRLSRPQSHQMATLRAIPGVAGDARPLLAGLDPPPRERPG